MCEDSPLKMYELSPLTKFMTKCDQTITSRENDFFRALNTRLNPEDFSNFKSKNIFLSDLMMGSLNTRVTENGSLENNLLSSLMMGTFEEDLASRVLATMRDETPISEFYVDVISTMYHNYGNHLYGIPKHVFIGYIGVLTESKTKELLSILNQVTDFESFKIAVKIFKKTKPFLSLFRCDNFGVILKFLIEDKNEGKKALEAGWRNFDLWKLHRRLEAEGKLPIYKNKDLEDFLWIGFSSRTEDPSINNIKSLTPLNEEIALKNVKGDGGAFILFEFHKDGIFETINDKYVPENLKGKVPKNILSKLFIEGKSLTTYYRYKLAVLGYQSKKNAANFDVEFARIPTTWNEWILVEWLFQKIKVSHKAMFKKRTKYLHGMEQKYTYFSIIDEIQPEDLVNGINTKPDVAFAHSKERINAKLIKENKELPVCAFKETRSVKQLKDTRAFIEEGKAMANCVAGYIESAMREHCFIYHINFHNQHGTMEINEDGDVVQLYGPGNDDPKPDVMYAVAEWLGINNLNVSEEIMDLRSDMKKDERTHFDEVYNINKMHYEDMVKA